MTSDPIRQGAGGGGTHGDLFGAPQIMARWKSNLFENGTRGKYHDKESWRLVKVSLNFKTRSRIVVKPSSLGFVPWSGLHARNPVVCFHFSERALGVVTNVGVALSYANDESELLLFLCALWYKIILWLLTRDSFHDHN